LSDPLEILWEWADIKDAIISGDDVLGWPPEWLDYLIRTSLVQPIESATSVACDACENGHVEDVTLIESPPGTATRTYIACPTEGRVRVPLERLLQWRIDFDGLAQAIAGSLSLAGQVEQVAADRLWLLGKATFAGLSRELFLGRGLLWDDASRVVGAARRFLSSRNRIILVAGEAPSVTLWGGELPVVVPLKILLSSAADGVAIDRQHIEGLLTGKRHAIPASSILSFPTPAGARWDELHITMAEHHLRAEMRGRIKQFGFAEVGFEDRARKKVPDRLWRILRRIAVMGGNLPPTDPDLDSKTRDNLKGYVSNIRKRLVAVFQIGGDPIKYENGQYHCQFKLSASEGIKFPTPSATGWKDVSIGQARKGVLLISVDATERFAAKDRSSANGGDAPKAIMAEQSGVIEREYDFHTLGLAGTDERPDGRYVALLQVIEGGGKLKRSHKDKDLLRLGKFLTDLMDISKPAFDYDQKRGLWVAQFTPNAKTRSAVPR
jgi:hypothetical protein